MKNNKDNRRQTILDSALHLQNEWAIYYFLKMSKDRLWGKKKKPEEGRTNRKNTKDF